MGEQEVGAEGADSWRVGCAAVLGALGFRVSETPEATARSPGDDWRDRRVGGNGGPGASVAGRGGSGDMHYDQRVTKGMKKSLAPRLLLSMPQLHDPNFRRTVVLLCEHGEEGAFGLVLNRKTDTPVSSVVRLTPPVDVDNGLQLWIGGPVEPERGWILMGHEPADAESVEVCEGLYLSTSPNLLRRLLEDRPPDRTRLLTGYAGWAAGQLDAELSASAWLIADVQLDLIFDVKAAQMWETAIRRLGADPTLLQMSSGVH